MSQTIKRGKHDKENPYFVVSRATAQDRRLSYEARGLLAYLLSKPGDWELRVEELALDKKRGEGKAGRDKIYAILDELAVLNYVRKSRKYQDGDGKWRWTPYEVFEEPQPDLGSSEKPDTVKPNTVEPDTGKPNTENPDTIQSTEAQITDSQTKEDKAESNKPAAVDAPRPNIFTLYEQSYGLLVSSQMLKDELLDLETAYPPDWLTDAFKKASGAHATHINYVKTILEAWSRKGKNEKPEAKDENQEPEAELAGSPYVSGEFGSYIKYGPDNE